MSKINFWLESKYFWLIFVSLSLPATWALAVPGFFGASDDMHIAWLYELDRAIRMGQIPPRFVPDLSFGFGYPLFNFIFPLPFYIAEIFHLIGLSLVDSIKAVFFLSVPVSMLGMYLLLRELASKQVALLGAVLYVYTPYRAVDLYIRGALGEIVAFMFLPFLTLSCIKIVASKTFSTRWIGIGALSVAGLILSHNIATYLFAPAIFALGLLFALFSKRMTVFMGIITMWAMGLLIGIYFWLPALLDSPLMKYDTVFNFSDHYPTIRQLLTPYWGYGASVPGPYDGMSFFVGLFNIMLFPLGAFFLWKNWSFLRLQKVILVWAFFAALSAIFMMNFRSAFLWDSIPLLPYFQFPWRFLMLITFVSPLFLLSIGKVSFVAPVFGILAIILLNFTYFRPQDFLGRGDGYYLNRYIPVPVASDEYHKIQEEYLRLPNGSLTRPDKNYPPFFPEGYTKSLQQKNTLNVVAEVSSDKGLWLNYSKYFFPGWQAKVDGAKSDIEAGQPFGQIAIFVPAGTHKVEIGFYETGFKKILDTVSIMAFAVSLVLIVKPVGFIFRH